ncbi:hypothetical protein DDQ41_18885 [Streptomyces spongiicola]|uniref:DUF1023 domain-containing protein n=1 Tax=Streptomyces spongiicola TaxID=1690221 RepID=A0ABM6V9H6_9ACTN|nr:alpha/beta hydrolase [Streptomyces spongiicola]AWK10620.1 hypothetical protein DDQ41_18885 [Streptomyces spongiicola]
MDLATLSAFKPAQYEEAADSYRATGDMARAAKDTVDNQICAGMRNRLRGEAAGAALQQLRELSKNFHYVQAECGIVSTALNGFAFDMALAKRKLDAALEDARAGGCGVNADGSVSYPTGRKLGDTELTEGGTVTGSTGGSPVPDALERQAASIHPNPHYGAALGYANRIAEALEEGGDADAKWAPRLRALTADDDPVVSARDWADAKSDTGGVRRAADTYLDTIAARPDNGTPEENAEWWKSLTQEQRADLLAVDPGAIGATNGLPSDIRDEANRMVLAETRAAYRLELDAIPKEPVKYALNPGYPAVLITPDWQEWREKHGDRKARLEGALKGMDAIQARFDSTGRKGLPEAYLLGFSGEGNGRVIIANGNPDTADHQAVYVPGTTSSLAGIGGDINRMVNVWRVAEDEADGGSVSTITWLGYDAPQSIVKDSPFSHYANDGAPAYNSFLDGLDASRSVASDAHRTAIGHSYGTTLIGSAARQGDLNVDDVILAGSPGVQVSKAEKMDVPIGHVWNQEADGDVVPDVGRYGHGGIDWDGPWTVPSDERFGANQMTTDTEGHSDYWKEDTESLLNQGLVVAGHGDEVTLQERRKAWERGR